MTTDTNALADLDDPDLIERLNDDGCFEAVDEIENLQRRFRKYIASAEQAFAEQQAEVVRLRAALAPFAELADEAKESSSATQCDRDDFFVTQIGGYNIGDLLLDDFLAARAALGGTDVTE